MAEAELAGIYCRLSTVQMGDTTKVDDQENEYCRPIAAARGWTVPDEFVWKDNNRSAWKRGRKREGWDAMLAAVEAGLVRNLVVYHGDRLVRQPWDLEQLLNLAEQRGITITSPTGSRNLDDPSDRFVLRILVAQACMESDNTSRRKKAGFARMAREGIAPWAGGRWGRGFGYDTAGRIPVPEEAAALREAAERLLGGERLTPIAADLTARGVTSVSGAPLTYQNLKDVLIRPRVAGLLGDGTPGNWEPVLDRATWEMVRGVLLARARDFPNNVSGNVKSLLSGIAVCGACGKGLQRHVAGLAGNLAVGYACVTPGCRRVHRNMAHLDAYVSRRVVNRLNSPLLAAALARPLADPVAAQITALEGRRRETRRVIGNLADHPESDLGLLTAALASFDRRIAELRDAAAGSAAARLLSAHAGITDEGFAALPLAVRRALVSAAYEVTVLPASRRGPGFRTEDVMLVRRGDAGDHERGGERRDTGDSSADGGGPDDAQVPGPGPDPGGQP